MVRLFLIILVSALFGVTGKAQNIQASVIKWSSEEFLEEEKNAYVEHESYFISYGGDSVQWFQKAGSYIKTLKVTEVEGSWSDISKEGSIIYKVHVDGNTGSLKFQRDGDLVSISMELEWTPGITTGKVFTVSSFENTGL